MAVARLYLGSYLGCLGRLDAMVLDVLSQREPVLVSEELRSLIRG